MFSVIFEVNRKPEQLDAYLDLANGLKPILQTIDGFVDNERFESQSRPGWLLSHSTWRDEKSVVRWRTQSNHHCVQEKGRTQIFHDYHLRVGEVVSDTEPPSGAPVREMRFDETEVGRAKYATLTEISQLDGDASGTATSTIPAQLGLSLSTEELVGHDVWKSINAEGKFALLCAWESVQAARRWTPSPLAGVAKVRHRIVRVVREYGMHDRREAPQYFPDVRGKELRGHKL